MWVYNEDINMWESQNETLPVSDFNFIKQELFSTRFYSKFLSGSTYVPINTPEDVYEILTKWKPRSWFISTAGSQYSSTLAPPRFATPIDDNSLFDYNTRFLSEYGLTLKNLFTPKRLIKDSLKNLIEVDLATQNTINLDLDYVKLVVDGKEVRKGNLILVKDQVTIETLDSAIDPATYFKSNYTVGINYGSLIEYSYYNSDNGIYLYDGLRLVKQNHFDDYKNCIRAIIYVKDGELNANQQFHLSRLQNGYYPTSRFSEPMEFSVKRNWMLRHRVDYNNIFDLNYYDVIAEGPHQYNIGGITYSIPERTISVGEFGSILNHQKGVSNLVPNKHKTNLRSISKTRSHYWICGDYATLLKVRKHDFEVRRINIDSLDGLKSVSFYDDQRGAVVGDLNNILLTFDGGTTWKRLRIDDFAAYNYTKVIFAEYNKIYICGRNGVFIEVEETLSGWVAYKRKIIKTIDKDDNVVLADNINDMLHTTIFGWLPTYNFLGGTFPTTFDCILMVTDGGNLIMYDTKKASKFEYTYLDLGSDFGDVINITKSGFTANFFFTNNDGLYTFEIFDFTNIGIDNAYSNTAVISKTPTKVSDNYANEIFDYDGRNLLMAGNNSLVRVGTYSSGGSMTTSTRFDNPDVLFESKLRSKMLFLNYDMASKLNFFTDSGEYRLPNDVTFDTAIGSAKNSYSLPLAATPSYAVDVNTLDPKEISKSIIVTYDPAKTRGRLKEIRVTVNVTTQASMASLLLRRKIGNNFITISLMRFGQQKPGLSGQMTDVTFSSNTNLPSIMHHGATFSGQTFRMDLVSPPFVLSPNLVVNSNKLSEIGNRRNDIDELAGQYDLVVYDHQNYGVDLLDWKLEFVLEDSYLAFYPKSTAPAAPSYLRKTEYNWWTYWSNREVNFEFGPTNSLPSDFTKILMSATFSSYASYSTNYPYVLSMTGEDVSTSKNDILKLVPNMDDEMFGRFSSAGAINLISTNAPSTNQSIPDFGNKPALYLWKYLAVLEVDNNWKVNVGDVIRVESSVVGANMVVNRIVAGSREVSGTQLPRRFVYMYTKFNDSIANDLNKTTGSINIRNLNTYVSIDNLLVNFLDHPISHAYGLTFSNEMNRLGVSAKFNSKTAYYNLGTIVEYDGVLGTMSYQDSFIKFGYSPTYNILDYLESINESATSPTFYAQKEYYSMPVYLGLQMLNPWTADTVYIDATGVTSSKYYLDTGNKIAFGPGLQLEWDTLMTNTFVDLEIYQPNATPTGTTFSTDRLLITKKYTVENYLGSGITGLLIEFHKRINFQIFPGVDLNNAKINIISRRKLGQISEDLRYMNNVQPDMERIVEIPNVDVATFSTFGNDLGFKIDTDAYAKILMSDTDTVNALSAIFYVDSKNELAMNITKLDKSYEIPINSTLDYNGYLYINCKIKHELRNMDGVVLEFTGGTYSSQFLNQQYFGYHTVKQVINEYDFVTDVAWGNQIFVGNDIGFVRYLRKDPFLNYEPVDLIEVGSSGESNVSIKLDSENLIVEGPTFSLVNLDMKRYRIKLVDSLTFERLSQEYPWILEAEISDAVIGENGKGLVWYKGVWESGRWLLGTWESGDWLYGDWYGGEWNSKIVEQKGLSYISSTNGTDFTRSVWRTGRWYGGTWNNGTWANGRWYGGLWMNGRWYNGIWNDGIWKIGKFSGGIWVNGKWEDGYFNCDSEPAFWINGEWMAGDFENGIWYNGLFGFNNTTSRFGINSSNSRTATWYGGLWRNGSFHSGPYASLPAVSDVHKYSIWYSGQWLGGDFYGGVAFNMMFTKGTWHGGILDEIQIIGMNSANNSLILNGIFRFNIGDEFYVIDNKANNDYSFIGSNAAPKKYVVLRSVLNESERTTEVYVDYDVEVNNLPAYRRESGKLDIPIPNFSTFITSTMSVQYSSNTITEVRVKVNLKDANVGDLLINLKAPNGQVINVMSDGKLRRVSTPLTLQTFDNGVETFTFPSINSFWAANPDTELVNTVFTSDNKFDDKIASPMNGLYQMDKLLNKGSLSGSIPVSTTNRFDGLTNEDQGISGDWVLYVKDMHPDVDLAAFVGNAKPVARYSNLGDNIRVFCQIFDDTKSENVRIGDVMRIRLTDGTTIESEIIGRIGGKSSFVASPITSFILAATASMPMVQNFVNSTTPFNNDAASVYYGTRQRRSVTCVVRSNPRAGNVLQDWELQFVNDTEVGAQIDYPRTDGIETGLRVVSDFKNVDWMSGIWTNGILESGNFNGGMWYNGIMKGKMS